MKKFFVFASGACLLVVGLYLYNYPLKNAYKKTDSTVFIKKDSSGYCLYRNNKPFQIQGATGKVQFKALSDIGGNTIRVYDTINIKFVLDRALKNNLGVIIDIPLPKYSKHYNYYSNKTNNNRLKKKVKKLVNTYKNHPALLIWNLGNEIDYPLIAIKNDFIKTYNELIDIIHLEDPNHPVGTTLIPSRTQTLGIHLHSSKIDIIGFNAFGNLKMIKPLMEKISYVKSPLPYYISEFGSNGPWEEKMTPWQIPIEQTSTKKAEQYTEQFHKYVGNDENSLGNLVFFWGQKQEHTHTWFSIFDEKGRKSEVYYSVKSFWGNPVSKSELPPQLKYMLIDDKGAKDRLVFNANETKSARVLMESEIEGEIDTTFTYKWEIYKEGWNYNQTESEDKPVKILETEVKADFKSFSFKVPNHEGPYRIFVYVYDQKGNFATSNTPFYVLKE